MTTNNVFVWSGTAGSNADVAGNGITGSSNISLGNDVFQNIMAQITNGMITRGSDIATASTVDFTAATTPSLLHDLTGTTTVTAVTMTAGWWRLCRAQGAFQLTASSTLVVNGSTSTNDTTSAGDLLIFFGYSASVVRVWRIPGGAGLPLTGGTLTGNLAISAAGNPFMKVNSTDASGIPFVDLVNATRDYSIRVEGASGSFNIRDNTGVTDRLTIDTSGIVKVTGGIYTSNATGGSKGADTINTTTYYKGGNYGVITLGTSVASTSGTSIDFTGIPAGVRRITVMFNGVSTNGSSNYQVQIGAGSVETTGYIASASKAFNSSASNAAATTGFILTVGISSSETVSGSMTIDLMGSNAWVASFAMSLEVSATAALFGGGSKTVGGTLDRVRITTVNGTDTFDAGAINISYE